IVSLAPRRGLHNARYRRRVLALGESQVFMSGRDTPPVPNRRGRRLSFPPDPPAPFDPTRPEGGELTPILLSSLYGADCRCSCLLQFERCAPLAAASALSSPS